MNSWTVTWEDIAEGELAAVWTLASDRRAVVAAQDRIDRMLALDPSNSGEYLSEGLYRIGVSPLLAYYEIDEGRHEVTVTRLFRAMRRV